MYKFFKKYVQDEQNFIYTLSCCFLLTDLERRETAAAGAAAAATAGVESGCSDVNALAFAVPGWRCTSRSCPHGGRAAAGCEYERLRWRRYLAGWSATAPDGCDTTGILGRRYRSSARSRLGWKGTASGAAGLAASHRSGRHCQVLSAIFRRQGTFTIFP